MTKIEDMTIRYSDLDTEGPLDGLVMVNFDNRALTIHDPTDNKCIEVSFVEMKELVAAFMKIESTLEENQKG